MDFDTKIAIVLDEQLAVWQKANVSAFLISGIVATDPTLVGKPYIDATGNRYLPMCRQPILIYAADRSGLRAHLESSGWPYEILRDTLGLTHPRFGDEPLCRVRRSRVNSISSGSLRADGRSWTVLEPGDRIRSRCMYARTRQLF